MNDISKLTVVKLRGLCKEQGLTDCSRLPEPALLGGLGFVTYGRHASTNLNLPGGSGSNAKSDVKKSTTNADIHGLTIPSSPSVINESNSTSTAQSSSEIFCQAVRSGLQTDTQSSLNPSYSRPAASGSPAEVTGFTPTASKRPADYTTDNTNGKPSKISKIQKNGKHISSHGMTRSFKVPDVPRPKGPLNLHTFDSGICATKLSQSVSQPEQHNYSLLNKKNSDVSISSLVEVSQVQLATSFPIWKSSGVCKPPLGTLKQRNLQLIKVPQTPPRSSSTPNGAESESADFLCPVVTPLSRVQPPSRPHGTKFSPPRPTSNTRSPRPGCPLTPLPLSLADDVHSIKSIPQLLEATVCQKIPNITIPPSISQRKHLPKISLAFTCLDDSGRATCVLVSKLFRYAVYVSAQDILKQNFSGERLSFLLWALTSGGNCLSMSNLWPYLRLRQREAFQRKLEYGESWVPRFFREVDVHTNPVSDKLWTSPDSHEQLSVVFRFVQTRICLALAHRELGDTALKWVRSMVVDAQQVLEDEIWSITVISPDLHAEETFHVLHTCEPIGRLYDANRNIPMNLNGFSKVRSAYETPHLNLRADWSDYVSMRLSTAAGSPHTPLIDYIRDTNPDDFHRGIARGWLKRMEDHGKEGALKRKVAERYVFSCVLGNSVSGQYRSTAQMVLELAGLPEHIETSRRHQKNTTPKVDMLIPERHNVESVHFTKSGQGKLHPALAVIQTAGRQEGTFVLKENGITLGEDELLPVVWMNLLQCAENGLV